MRVTRETSAALIRFASRALLRILPIDSVVKTACLRDPSQAFAQAFASSWCCHLVGAAPAGARPHGNGLALRVVGARSLRISELLPDACPCFPRILQVLAIRAIRTKRG